MSTYVVTYDLSAPGRDYSGLIAHLKTYAYAHVAESSWVVDTYKTAAQVRDGINPFVDSNDKVLVIETTASSAWIGLPSDVENWLRNHLLSAA